MRVLRSVHLRVCPCAFSLLFFFGVYLFCLPEFLCVYVLVYIAFSLCLPNPGVFVCLRTCVCVWLVEDDEKPSVWQGSHCGRCSVYTSFWHGLCVKHTVLLWPLQTAAYAHSSVAFVIFFIFTSFTAARIRCCKNPR